jgi:hypothetical protein
MNILNWVMSLGSQIVQWIIRPRNHGIALLGRCSVVTCFGDLNRQKTYKYFK